MQAFRLKDRTLATLIHEVVDLEKMSAQLDDLQLQLVQYAVAELDGAFTLKTLYNVFKGQISWRQLKKLARSWEARGWLTSRPDAVSPGE